MGQARGDPGNGSSRVTKSGLLALVLHAHLPYVRHPEHPRHLEEHWLFEAITECYLPLLAVLRDAAERRTAFRLTVSLSPTLLSMLRDPMLQERYLDYLARLIRLCRREFSRLARDRGMRALADDHLQRLIHLRDFFRDGLGGDLIAAWTELQDAGLVELMTSAATHGYLPLLRANPAGVRAQLRVGREGFRELTGRDADGVWLPECGYYPGLEQEIAAAGFRYTVLDAHGIQQGWPPPQMGVYAPLDAGGVAVFGRDPDSAQEVWSRESGYPGHPFYREYHRDLGLEAEPGHLADFLPPGVKVAPTGIKYFRVTGGDGPKDLYEPAVALQQAVRDASRFVSRRLQLLSRVPIGSCPPVITAAYDAELLGHWWYEGPAFLAALSREIDASSGLAAITLGAYLKRYGTAGDCRPAPSSWGERGYNAAWLRPETGWVHLWLHQASVELGELIGDLGQGAPTNKDLGGRLLRQAARSLLLAQSSDWTFHMGRGGGADYSETRLRDQIARFSFLTDALRKGVVPRDRLATLEQMDNLFPDLDLGHFACATPSPRGGC